MPNRDELLVLLATARASIQESEEHWGAVIGLTGDRHYQRQQREAVALLDAMRRRVEMYRPHD